MLPIVISALAAIRRYLKKIHRGFLLVADGIADAEKMQRRALRKYPYIGE